MNKDTEQFKIPSFFYDESDKDESEILIDYFISWTIRCAVSDNEAIPFKIREYAKKILLKILENEEEIKNASFSDIIVKKVITFKQWERIDVHSEVILEINGVIKEYAIAFENKLYTHIHGNQLADYREVFEKYYTNVKEKSHYKTVYIFLTCHEPVPEQDIAECKKHGYHYFSVQELKNSFKSDELTGNYLFDEFWFRYY